MSVNLATVVSVLGALGIGSIMVQWVAGARDRRAARASVLQALADVETARWEPREPEEPSFRHAVRSLQAAAVIARLPREPLHLYLLLAQTAHWDSQETWEQLGDPAYGGGIHSGLADLVRDAAQLVAEGVWRPVPFRWLKRSHLARLEARTSVLQKDKAIAEKLARARQFVL